MASEVGTAAASGICGILRGLCPGGTTGEDGEGSGGPGVSSYCDCAITQLCMRICTCHCNFGSGGQTITSNERQVVHQQPSGGGAAGKTGDVAAETLGGSD